tara:strand:+ start:2029 stop:2871 length:843 start_codon:yes stop_codon:yes gene_type:complete
MKVGIIGYGFVGKALAAGIKNNVEILKIDPVLKTSIIDLKEFDPDICFICVPTPMKDDGSQDLTILRKVIDEINEISISALVVLKSTVLPNYITSIKHQIPNLIFNPEFLRERSANKDFLNSKLIVFGGPREQANNLANFYEKHTLCTSTNYQFTDLISASLIKYAINTFLATKVVFFNELNQIFNKSDADDTWDNFINIISIDERIGSSHMQVPGLDDKLGFGGTCFPKDCKALIKYSEKIENPFQLLKKSNQINNQIRKQYKSLSNREAEQNTNFNDD